MAFIALSSVKCSFVRPASFLQLTGSSTSLSPLRPRRCSTRVTATPRVTVLRASIEQEVSTEMKQAMRAKDTTRLSTLRSIRAAFLTARKTEGGPGADEMLPDSDAMAALRKLAKMRQESIDIYRKAGRDDRAQSEQDELDIISQWLPKLAGEDQVSAWVEEAVKQTGASKPGDMGKVMGIIMKKHREEVDGNLVRKLVSEVLKE